MRNDTSRLFSFTLVGAIAEILRTCPLLVSLTMIWDACAKGARIHTYIGRGVLLGQFGLFGLKVRGKWCSRILCTSSEMGRKIPGRVVYVCSIGCTQIGCTGGHVMCAKHRDVQGRTDELKPLRVAAPQVR